jgi:Flp pilus assembly protein TadG
MSIRMRLREERAQATVEMAVVTPVLLVLALIVYNVMIFASAVARFDRVVPDIVLAHAVASEGEGGESSADASATVQTQILNAMEGYDLQIEVSSEQGAEASDGGLLSRTFRTYTCTMHYEPWPTSLSIAGVPLGAPTTLSHERAVTVDPWRPGVVM